MSRKLSDLEPELRDRILEVINLCGQIGISVMVIDTLRTLEEHAENLRAGTSWIKRSRHLPNAKGLAEACDLAPTVYVTMKGWNPTGAHWQTMGEFGEKRGLVWGGRWKKRDLGHFELPRK